MEIDGFDVSPYGSQQEGSNLEFRHENLSIAIPLLNLLEILSQRLDTQLSQINSTHPKHNQSESSVGWISDP